MTSKFNDALEMIDSLSIEEQEMLLEIESKRLTERKRKILQERIAEGKKDISEGRFIEGNAADIMNSIDDEIKTIQ
ncbi:MAG: hypothetical protein IAE90_01195 [Ignavibacteria bacterium]|nr:hypothetical protein [Ignavibacteria bacterium]